MHPFGVAVHAGFVFWSDWSNRTIFRADVDEDVGGVNLFRIQGNINLPMSIVFVSSLSARPGGKKQGEEGSGRVWREERRGEGWEGGEEGGEGWEGGEVEGEGEEGGGC